MPHTEPPRGVMLSPQAFAAAFPFHLVVGPDMCVRQVGATLARLLPAVAPGVPLQEHFRLVGPSVPFDFAHLSDRPRDVVSLESTAVSLRLKGQMLHSPEQECVVFLCSPDVTDLQSMSSLGLAVEDFAIHDSTIDFMMALQSAQATLSDLQKTTDLLRTERAALDDSNSRSRAMLDTSQDAVIALDDQGLVLEFNGAAERIFGCPRTRVVGEDFAARFIPDGCRPTFRHQLLGLPHEAGQVPCGGLQSGDGPRTELTACTWDGRQFPAELSMTRVERSRGAIYVGFIRDITDRHVAMAELLKARDDAETANRAKSEFLARMSHEIRTPLHAILGMTELALASQLTREQRDFLESVRSSSDALLYLINDLLDFSKIEAGQMDIERSDFDLWQLVEGVSDAAAVKASAKGLGVVCWIDPDVPHQVVGDPNRLRQVLMNLAGNAVKFTEQGQVVVRVSAAPEGPISTVLRLSVTDTGPGISESDRPRIFERFFQAQRSNTNRVAGTGLGLSITRTLVELMGGSIGFDSRVGAGTTFTVMLPLEIGDRPSRQRTWHDLPSEPVLVVDPEVVERDMIRSHLEHHGCTVQLARTASDALAQLATQSYSAAVINHQLPDQTGLELIRTIRSERPGDPMRIVLIGTVPSPQLVGSVVSDCVVKPVHASRLLDALDTRVSADRTRAALVPLALPPAHGTARPLRILVAEDNAENQRVATRVLEGAGAQIDIAQDGQTAVDMAVRTRYDLILMDLQMPVLDGSQAAVAIRDAERTIDEEPVPIVAFTAHAVEGFREQCLQAGMNDYIVKPITTQDLVEAVHRWADRRPAVLVADDSPEIRQLVKHRLRDTYRVVQAVNGRDALEQFGRQQISVVLLDMNMPVMDGYATAAAIRLREDGRHVPIVAVTGNEEAESRERAAAAGCTMHLMKPVRLATLFSTVEAAMRQSADTGTPAAADAGPTGTGEAPVHLDIDPLLADLVPGYVREKRRQIGDLRRLIGDHDMDRVKRIAHDIKGTGSAYGIPDVTRLGRALETAGQQRDEIGAAGLVEELDALLARVQQQLGG